MDKEIIEFPYDTRKEHLRSTKPIDEFKLNYIFCNEFPQSRVYKCFYKSIDNSNFVGYIFSSERLHSDAVKWDNDKKQENLEAYMDAAREIFFNSEKDIIEKYFISLEIEETEQKVTFAEILLFKSFLNKNKGKFDYGEFQNYKSSRNYPLLVFIQDIGDSNRLGFNDRSVSLFLMLKKHLLLIEETNEFFHKNESPEDFPLKTDDKDTGGDTISIVFSEISDSLEELDAEFMFNVLPGLYLDSYNSEFLKFSILYQYLEILMGSIVHKLLDETIRGEPGSKSVVDIKKKINDILSESVRISYLFGRFSNNACAEYTGSLEEVYNKIIEFINNENGNISRNEGLAKQIYHLRNLLYHNLRVFRNKEILDKLLGKLNITFEHIVASLLEHYNIEN